MKRKLLDDCFKTDKDRLSHDQALALLQERIAPIAGSAQIEVAKAHNQILAENITAPRPIPAYNNAAVDGYAFAYADYDAEKGVSLPLHGRSAAGHAFLQGYQQGTVLRIFTGAAVPEGYDCVVMQEDVDIELHAGANNIYIPPGLKQGANIRRAGEDAGEGDMLCGKGQRLQPQHIASLASAGIEKVSCFAPLRIGVFSTGDELRVAGQDLAFGQVYDANRPMLHALIEQMGAQSVDLGILPDEQDKVEAALKEAAPGLDMLITSGGASRGEEDYVVKSISEIGELHMWQISVKPGRPLSFGQIGECAFIGLPGNPVAAFVCTLLFIRPMIAGLSGGLWPTPRRFQVASNFELKKKPDRREFLRGILIADSDGGLTLDKYPFDGSGRIASLRAADGLIDIHEDVREIKKGDLLNFIPFSEFGL